jgi:hypothetical protein
LGEAWLDEWNFESCGYFLGVFLHRHYGELIRQSINRFAEHFELLFSRHFHRRVKRHIPFVIAAKEIRRVK